MQKDDQIDVVQLMLLEGNPDTIIGKGIVYLIFA